MFCFGEEKEARHVEQHHWGEGKSRIPPFGWRFTYDGLAYRVDCCGYSTGRRAKKLRDKIHATEGRIRWMG